MAVCWRLAYNHCMNTRVYVSVLVQNQGGQVLLVKRSPDSKFAAGPMGIHQWQYRPRRNCRRTAVRRLIEEAGIGMTNLLLTPGNIRNYRRRWSLGGIAVQSDRTRCRCYHEPSIPIISGYQLVNCWRPQDVASDYSLMSFTY